jgi:thiamine-monophosphate kinase
VQTGAGSTWSPREKRLHTKKRWKKLLRKHFYPEPRLALGQRLAELKCATAMIDTSDGLSTDLRHICLSSNVGARIWAEKIPVVSVPAELRRLNLDPLRLALHGGEDYELLFTVPKRLASLLTPRLAGVPVTIIGEIRRGKGIILVGRGGVERPLRPRGWDPFLR